MENVPLASVAAKIILKMYFQRGSSRDCPVQQQGTPRAGPGQCHQPCPCGHQGHTQSEGTASLSAGSAAWGKHPMPLKSSFGSLIKKQGSQRQGIDFHQLISITSFHHQLPYSTKLLETIFIDCSSSRQKRPWLIICYPQTPCAFQIITWCSTEEMNWMCSQ